VRFCVSECVCVFMYVSVCGVCVYACVCMCISACVLISIVHTYSLMHTHIFLFTFTHAHTHSSLCTHMFAHAYTLSSLPLCHFLLPPLWQVREFDDRMTRKAFGYATVEEYHTDASSHAVQILKGHVTLCLVTSCISKVSVTSFISKVSHKYLKGTLTW
jgi:hypothetical protein